LTFEQHRDVKVGAAPYDRAYAISVLADGIAFNRDAAAAVREGSAP
jgi:hypothetical protein